ncbi:MAG TPA: hypothetical protein VM677_24700 [Actinokineospora sp.]|nr:hypothetical protein [Actinokineospora sp.]
MAEGRLRRRLVRLINDENVDLYVLAAVATLFTILGAAGISDVKTPCGRPRRRGRPLTRPAPPSGGGAGQRFTA